MLSKHFLVEMTGSQNCWAFCLLTGTKEDLSRGLQMEGTQKGFFFSELIWSSTVLLCANFLMFGCLFWGQNWPHKSWALPKNYCSYEKVKNEAENLRDFSAIFSPVIMGFLHQNFWTFIFGAKSWITLHRSLKN